MTQYSTVKMKLSNWQLNRLKLGIENGTEVTLNLLSNVISNSNGQANFSRKLLLTNKQISRLRKAIANNLSANVKLSQTHLSKTGQ